ncbi:MAG TPA: hypothetical protein VGR55_13755 [Candidatus Acidoferrum sp.]|nr:hypothetical protein [Candidatus Acidoferrum sp.]
MPPKVLFKIGGGACILVAIVYSLNLYWFTTRTFEPVDMPIRLDQGKVQTGVFEINLRETYYVNVVLDPSIDDYYEDRCNYKRVFGSQWKLYRQIGVDPKNAELLVSWEDNDPQRSHVGDFAVGPGTYQLEWQGPTGAGCLNSRHPRLNVSTDSSSYETTFDFVLFGCWLVAWVGSGAILRAMVVWLQGVLRGTWVPRIFPDIAVPSVIRLLRPRTMPLIRDFPNFGLIHGFILWVLMFLFMIMQPGPSNGLFVNFKGERTVIVGKNPWAETMAVYIDGKQRFFVNGKSVAREELRSKLEKELLRRGVWVVYFEADVNCLYMDAVYAMDTIQGLGAKMIWITPKTRAEWKKREAPRMSKVPASRIP